MFSNDNGNDESWRPLLIIIPLRLGLTTFNQCYHPAIEAYFQMPQCTGIIGGRPNHALYFVGITDDKAYFQMPQCTGIIGGRPNHALYFVGITDNKLLYLDPHFCQNFVDLGRTEAGKGDGDDEDYDEESVFDDNTYHCPYILSMPYEKVDPSLALSFICPTEKDYNDLIEQLQTRLLPASKPPLFELLETRPKNFPPFVPYTGEVAHIRDYTHIGDAVDSYDEFEILSE
ncbi:unnamed protein product [Gongylonema pulchrum]|uniref:Cysteine protease n=1 Tax=Gongylonema pulchrum TaxID=637853 RepID=A0A3P7LJV9_9BILA|nr:unnamed protein product [Gongylonema pulchrum]